MTAQNNKTPVNSLDNLAKDKDEKVRLAVAHNFSCSLNTLKRLTKDDNENIRYVAKRNMENRYK